MSSLIGSPGIETTTPGFRAELVRTAAALGIDPDYLATVISFESKFSPTVENQACLNAGKTGCAVGLIQFTSDARTELDVTSAALKAMSAEEQLAYVRRYFARKGFAPGRPRSLEDTYLAVFWPAAIGKDLGTSLYKRGSVEYALNSGFDRDGKGYVTAGDVTRDIRAHHAAGQSRPRVPVVGGPSWPVAPRSGGAAVAVLALGAGAVYLYLKRKRG